LSTDVSEVRTASIDNHFTRQYNPEDSSEHHTRRRENLKSQNRNSFTYKVPSTPARLKSVEKNPLCLIKKFVYWRSLNVRFIHTEICPWQLHLITYYKRECLPRNKSVWFAYVDVTPGSL
jgi:hypothetical protein